MSNSNESKQNVRHLLELWHGVGVMDQIKYQKLLNYYNEIKNNKKRKAQ